MEKREINIESPVIRLEIGEDETIDLNYANARLRTFDDEELDHIEYRDEDGQLKGLRVGRAVLDLLFEHDFPYSFDYVQLDQQTQDWYARSEAKRLDDELDNL